MTTSWADRDTFDSPAPPPANDDAPAARRFAEASAYRATRRAVPEQLDRDIRDFWAGQDRQAQRPLRLYLSDDDRSVGGYSLGHHDGAVMAEDDRPSALVGILIGGFCGLVCGILIGLLLAGQVVSSGVLR